MSKCEFCGNQKLIQLKKTNLLDKPADIFLCSECGHVFKSPLEKITNDDVEKYYQNIRYNDERIIRNQQKKQIQFLVENKTIDTKEKSALLEIGGGVNGLINLFPDLDKYALELNRAVQEKMKSLGIKVLDSLKDLQTDFDIIILSHVFEHIIDNPFIYISDLMKLLSDKGSIFIEVPHLAYELYIDKQNNVCCCIYVV